MIVTTVYLEFILNSRLIGALLSPDMHQSITVLETHSNMTHNKLFNQLLNFAQRNTAIH